MKTCTKCGETKEINKGYTMCKACKKAYDKARYNPEKEAHKKRRIKYGLSIEQYEQMLVDQNHQCYICNDETKLVVDHCHESGKVRGLLCNHCNTMLGLARDNPAILRLAAKYIELAK